MVQLYYNGAAPALEPAKAVGYRGLFLLLGKRQEVFFFTGSVKLVSCQFCPWSSLKSHG